MKKISLSLFFIAICAIAHAQTDTLANKPIIDRIIGKNEVKVNLLYVVVGQLGNDNEIYLPEITYERIIDEGFTVGISAWRMAPELEFLIAPYVRVYSGKKTNGLFFEFNAAVLKAKYNYRRGHDFPPVEFAKQPGKELGKGIGLAAGYKFLDRNGFIMETYLGYGKSTSTHEGRKGTYYYPRFGITMGQRF